MLLILMRGIGLNYNNRCPNFSSITEYCAVISPLVSEEKQLHNLFRELKQSINIWELNTIHQNVPNNRIK